MRYIDISAWIFEHIGVPFVWLVKLLAKGLHLLVYATVGIFYFLGIISGSKAGKILYAIIFVAALAGASTLLKGIFN